MIQEVVAKQGINWRSWFAGGIDGPIPRQWHVTSWPTIFVIDARGVIRHQLGTAQDLERIIDGLLREVERG